MQEDEKPKRGFLKKLKRETKSKSGSLFKRKQKETIPSPPPQAIPKGYKVVERYPLYEPFAHAAIGQNQVTGEHKYFLDELQLDTLEQNVYDKILEILLAEIASPKEDLEDPRKFFITEAEKILGKYRISLGWLRDVSWSKILYHAQRNLVGFGKIDSLMRDPNIEDISCDGVEKPVYIWHRRYENLETNMVFHDDQELDDSVVKLVHMAGKHVSSAFPVVDASLPAKHRLAVCYRREVTPFGTAFTIRKFREDPYSIIDLINLGTLSEEMAAYLWTCLDNRASLMVLGGTASGKTTFLNAVACLIKPGSKIITIEETAELNLPHENWVSLIARRSYGLGENLTGEVTLFDLVKTSMRHRPDLIVVGEIRGSEAYTLFQALATGHGGMATMHADSIDSAVKRLIQKPMDIAPAYMPLMNIVASIRRVHLAQSKKGEMAAYRRVISVDEVADYEDYRNTFKWNAADDAHHSNFKNSIMLESILESRGLTRKELVDEIERRENVLRWMQQRNIRSYKAVAEIFTEYNAQPDEFYNREVMADATVENS